MLVGWPRWVTTSCTRASSRTVTGPRILIDGANRNDLKLLQPTLDSIITNGLIDDIELLALDRAYDYPVVRARLAGYDLVELEIQERGAKPPPGTPHRLTLGLR